MRFCQNQQTMGRIKDETSSSYVILLLCSPLILPRCIASGCTTCLLAELSTWKRNINPYKAGVKKDHNMYGGWAFQLDEGRQILSTRSRRPVPVSRTAPAAAAVYRSTVPHNNRIRVHKGEGHVEGQISLNNRNE